MLSCSCNECGNVIDEGSESYCESCFHDLKDRIEELESDNDSMVNQIENLEKEIGELKNKE